MHVPKYILARLGIIFAIGIVTGLSLGTVLAAVMDGWTSTATLSAGAYHFTVPDILTGGIFTHSASNNAGTSNSCVVQYDPLPPVMDTWSYTKTSCNVLMVQMNFDEQGLSGLRKIYITVTNPDKSKDSYQPTPANNQVYFEHTFDQTGEYLIDYLTEDNANNTGGGILKTQIQAAASCNNDIIIQSDVVIEDQSDALCGNSKIDIGEQCDDGNTDNGDSCSATCQFEFNGTEIVGMSRSNLALTKRTSAISETSIGDLSQTEARAAMQQNIAPFLNDKANIARACTSPAIITSTNWDTFPCAFEDGGLLFFTNTSVLLDDTSGTLTLPPGAHTLLVYNGNIHIQSNLTYPDATSTFGMLTIERDNKDVNPLNDGGNVYIGPSVTNINGYLHADNAVVGLDTAGKLIKKHTLQTIAYLRNQLYWRGSVSSLNTIGGSDRRPAQCPSAIEMACELSASSDGEKYRALTRIFDLNYLRAFHENVTGIRAGRKLDGSDDPSLPNPPNGMNNNHALIIEYDGRIISNPPPLFSSDVGLKTGEVGY